ncbi:MAG: hypothetical protein NZO16_07395 [Deltaproteobacteria bacterium]|nr:hypothetical protein [Deltaproteobacteria bacterium]
MKKLFFLSLVFVMGFRTAGSQPQCLVHDLLIHGTPQEINVSTRGSRYRVVLPKDVFTAAFARFNVRSTSGTANVTLDTNTGRLIVSGRFLRGRSEVVRISGLAGGIVYGLIPEYAAGKVPPYNYSEEPKGHIDDDDLLAVLFALNQKTGCDPETGAPHVLDRNRNGIFDDEDLNFVLNYFGTEIFSNWWYGGNIMLTITRR